MLYLTVTKADVVERPREASAQPADPARRRTALGILASVTVITIGLLVHANSLPHTSALADEGAAPSCTTDSPPPTQAEAEAAAHANFPAARLTDFTNPCIGHPDVHDRGRPGRGREARDRPRDCMG